MLVQAVVKSTILIYLILPRRGIADATFRIHVATQFLSCGDIQFLIPPCFQERNNIDLDYFLNGLGFSCYVNQPELTSLGCLELANPKYGFNEIFCSRKLLDISGSIYIDLDVRFSEIEGLDKFKKNLPKSSDVFEKAYKHGSLSKLKMPKDFNNRIFVHYRLGDVAFVPGNLIDEFFSLNCFKEHVFLGTQVIEHNPQSIQSHLATRPAVAKRITHPTKYHDSIKTLQEKGYKIALASDGFTRVLEAASKKSAKIAEAITNPNVENEFTQYYFDHFGINLNSLNSWIIGESSSKIKQAFEECLSSAKWVQGTSGFPFVYFVRAGLEPRFVGYIHGGIPDFIKYYA